MTVASPLAEYEELKQAVTLEAPHPFPGRWGRGHLHSDSASIIFREGCKQLDIEGASTHSFRRTALTLMSNADIPLRVIQEISGHTNLEQLQNYLEVETSQVRGAMVKHRQRRSPPCPCLPQWPTAR